jgi:hypothetical protein
VEIADHPALVRELRLLERIPGRIGKDQVTHPRGVNDDLANCVCGALAMAALAAQPMNLEAMQRANARLRQMGNYNARRQGWSGGIGERRAGQLARAADRRTYGW